MPRREELERLAIVAQCALSDQNENDDFDERYGELVSIMESEADYAQLLEFMSQTQLRARSIVGAQGKRFDDWLGQGTVFVADIIDDARDLDDLRARLVSTENPVRVCGKRHSENDIAMPDPESLVVDLSNFRIKASAGAKVDTPCKPCTNRSDIVVAPHVEHRSGGKRYVLAFSWETLQDIADRGANPSTGVESHKFALINTGSFTHQTLAGPMSVGTHGSGGALGAMCDAVVAVDILRLDGKVKRAAKPGVELPSSDVNLPDGRGSYAVELSSIDFNAAVVNLGTLGVALAYWIEVVDFYFLEQSVEETSVIEALDWYENERRQAASPYRHVELLLMPEKLEGEYRCSLIRRKKASAPSTVPDPIPLPDIARVMRCNPAVTRDNATFLSQSKVGRKIMYRRALSYQQKFDGRVAPWSDILIRNTMVPAHGFEVAVPIYQAKRAVQCVLEAVDIAGRGFGKRRCKPTSPIGVRFVAASDQYLAMSHRHFEFVGKSWTADEWCFIEVPRLLGAVGQKRMPREIIKRLKSRGVFYRLHWGQYAPEGSRDAAREYPSLRKWLASRVIFGASSRLLTRKLSAALGLPVPPRPRSLSFFTGPDRDRYSSLRARPVSRESEAPLVLCVHGIGDHRSDEWKRTWRDALSASLEACGGPQPRFVYVGLDDLFEEDQLGASELSGAILHFASSWLRNLGGPEASRSLLDGPAYLWEWFPAMVAKWAGDEALRARLRARVADAISSFQPALICAHSLGSLVCYDTLTHSSTKHCTDFRASGSATYLLSFGSQIGHPAVRFVWGGRLVMPQVTGWTHLYNPEDDIFTAPIRLSGDSAFHQFTLRGEGGPITQHDARTYLGHKEAVRHAVLPLLRPDKPSNVTSQTAPRIAFPNVLRAAGQSGKRALLVGIDRHADSSWNLGGCVNDVYRISQALQRRLGYDAHEVRLLVDERATSDSIRDRLRWLLDGAQKDDQRLFYFSGHGAKIPGYNALEQIDQQDECLVPFDFAWTNPSSALVDDEFVELYSQLPYSVRFTAIFDCCHAGGMSRGGGASVRGLTPPDDIRHRALSFSEGAWRDRARLEDKGDAVRLPRLDSVMKRSFPGAARSLRGDALQFRRARGERDHDGPYMPALIYACSENELAFEHRSGTTAHGAFTFALTELLETIDLTSLSHAQLMERLGKRLHALGYSQTPKSEGPKARFNQHALI